MDNWLTAGLLDRVDEHRERADWVAHQWLRDDAQLLQVDARGNFTVQGDHLRFVRPFGDFDPQQHFLLGTLDDAPIFVEETITDGDTKPLRLIGHRLGAADREIATVAAALLGWHRSERHCGRCGGTCQVQRGGYTQRCTSCGAEHFPRHDPAVIVAVLDDDDRIFLGHHRDWDPGRMSLLAGFVEVGESFEQAVHREIGEEADLQLDVLRYVGSQAWPFPRSLMVGFVAHAVGTEFDVDEREIEYGEWFTREQMRARVADGSLKLPGGSSIAHRIIQDWVAGRLTTPRG